MQPAIADVLRSIDSLQASINETLVPLKQAQWDPEQSVEFSKYVQSLQLKCKELKHQQLQFVRVVEIHEQGWQVSLISEMQQRENFTNALDKQVDKVREARTFAFASLTLSLTALAFGFYVHYISK